jgi:uncharacterized protein (DUF1684 family)
MSELKTFRQRKDEFFGHDPHSPLLPEQKDGFDGLSYFDENPDLRFVLDLEVFDEHERVTMQTSTGSPADYLRWGKIAFRVGDQEAALTVFVAINGGGYFLPFMDATNGVDTYGAGRYLEIDPQADGSFVVDFNMAYNPYCAYNPMWTCPIPPKENRLSVPIEAGEKAFEKEMKNAV